MFFQIFRFEDHQIGGGSALDGGVGELWASVRLSVAASGDSRPPVPHAGGREDGPGEAVGIVWSCDSLQVLRFIGNRAPGKAGKREQSRPIKANPS
jgi:hypothetical protein